MKRLLLILLLFPSIAFAVPGKVGQIKMSQLNQGIDGTCRFGYGQGSPSASLINAYDTVLKYVDVMAPWAWCVEEANYLKDPVTNPQANTELKMFQYISLGDMPPSYPTDWATVGDWGQSRKVGWFRNWIDSTVTPGAGLTSADEQERLYLHYYDNTQVNAGGGTFTIPGTFGDSSQIRAADSISRVPNNYTRQTSYWSGNLWTAPTRLFGNLTAKNTVDAYIAYIVYFVTNQNDDAAPGWNFLPNSAFYFDGPFFDNSMDFGLGPEVIGGVGGHIVESFDVSWGAGDIDLAYAAKPDTLQLTIRNTNMIIPAQRNSFDNWYWDEMMKPFFHSLDSVLDTLVTPTGVRPQYARNAGHWDYKDHSYDDLFLGQNYAVNEWGGTGDGNDNRLWSSPDARAFAIDSVRVLDSLAIARGSFRTMSVRLFRFSSTVPNTGVFFRRNGGVSGGGTQNWHEAQTNTYIKYLLLNSANTYYELFDSHIGYGTADPTPATSLLDSIHYGPQGTFNLRATLNRDFGASLQAHPYKYQVITADGQQANIWARDYSGNGLFPNNFKVLYREPVVEAGPWMSNSTPTAIILDATYRIYGNDYAKGNLQADTMDFWHDSLTTAAYSTIYLRAGEGAILYASSATDNPATILSFDLGAVGTADNDTICTGATKSLQYNATDGEGIDSVFIVYSAENNGGNPDTLYSRFWGGSIQALDAAGYTFATGHAPDSIYLIVVDTAANRSTKRIDNTTDANDLIPVTLLGRCAGNQPPIGSVIGPVAVNGDSICTSDSVLITITLSDDTDIDEYLLTYIGDTILIDTILTIVTDTTILFTWGAPDTAIVTQNAIFLKAFDNVGDSVFTATVNSFNVEVCTAPGPKIYRVGPARPGGVSGNPNPGSQ